MLAFISFSCTDKKPDDKSYTYDEESALLSVNLDKLLFREVKYSEIFDDYEVIPLETNKKCLISEVENIIQSPTRLQRVG